MASKLGKMYRKNCVPVPSPPGERGFIDYLEFRLADGSTYRHSMVRQAQILPRNAQWIPTFIYLDGGPKDKFDLTINHQLDVLQIDYVVDSYIFGSRLVGKTKQIHVYRKTNHIQMVDNLAHLKYGYAGTEFIEPNRDFDDQLKQIAETNGTTAIHRLLRRWTDG